jgi:hypothetical protein
MCHFPHTPLYPDQLSVRSFFRPPLLETRPQQGWMVKSLRICGREPLRSAHRLPGFTILSWFWDPSRRLVARPSRGPRCLQDPICLAAPDSFLGRHHHRDPVAMRLITATFARGRGGECLCCSRDGPGHFVGSPPHWISASIRLETLAFYWRQDRKRYSRRDARDVRAEFRRNQAPFAATSEGRRRVVDGLFWPKRPG